ncbi:MAG: hypothetical protein ACRDLQ_01275 [Solirubrobacterales bacterium]
MTILIAGAAVLAIVAGVAPWWGDPFPARSEPLAGTPVELRIQDGVTVRELHAIRAGVRLVHRFARRSLDWEVRGPVEARVAREDRCRGSAPSARELIGEGSGGFLCVDTANVQWQVLIHTDPLAALAVSGHEYVHVLQAELGCLPERDAQEYRWIVEGMATHVAWRALASSGLASDARVRRTIARDGAFDSHSEPLRHYERAGGRTPQYALWHAAMRSLLREAVANGAAPAARPETALREFCERVGRGVPWRTAFARGFGLSPADFYARFEGPGP